ncbi:hypothetical protein [Mesorhizobium sp. B2-1-3A]|uniref:hypothetical protein n=1 Tax=Mesorhizobium sp. B2-1-3A TaxID=2589971 RepID=UPI0015E355E4|nr:hypothetical protein [Mesorhizobium sp. B2-1-3A]
MDSRAAISAAPTPGAAHERGLARGRAANTIRTHGRRGRRLAALGVGTTDPVVTIIAPRPIRIDGQLLRIGRGLSVKRNEPDERRRAEQKGKSSLKNGRMLAHLPG